MRLTDSLIQFDTLYLDGETAPRVMAIAVHPFVTGQPHRIGALEYICSHDGVWRATGWEIVSSWLGSRPRAEDQQAAKVSKPSLGERGFIRL